MEFQYRLSTNKQTSTFAFISVPKLLPSIQIKSPPTAGAPSFSSRHFPISYRQHYPPRYFTVVSLELLHTNGLSTSNPRSYKHHAASKAQQHVPLLVVLVVSGVGERQPHAGDAFTIPI